METSTHETGTPSPTGARGELPRSLAALRTAWREVVTGSVGDGEHAAAAVTAIHDEAAPHRLGCTINEIRDVNVGPDGCTLTVSVHTTGTPANENEMVEVDPRVAGLYCRRSATERLERHLRKADEDGAWTTAVAMAEAILLVLRTDPVVECAERVNENRPIDNVETGRLRHVKPELAEAIHDEVRRGSRPAAASLPH